MILFLDFDGVLHPMSARTGAESFCYVPRFENVLRKFSEVKIVITSTQREHLSLSKLKHYFSVDIAERIIGITPILPIKNAEDIFISRYREILTYLNNTSENWVALDDDITLFPRDCPELIMCNDGFHDAEDNSLRAALKRASLL